MGDVSGQPRTHRHAGWLEVVRHQPVSRLSVQHARQAHHVTRVPRGCRGSSSSSGLHLGSTVQKRWMFILCWCIMKCVPLEDSIHWWCLAGSDWEKYFWLFGEDLSELNKDEVLWSTCHSITVFTCVYFSNIFLFVLQPEEQILGKWAKVLVSNIKDKRRPLVVSCRKYKICSALLFRYGGISVGGRLPVLDLDPKTIQNAASQLGRLLNVTGVSCVCIGV